MSELVIQIPSVEKLNLLKELTIQLGGSIVPPSKRVVNKRTKEVPFSQLSVSSLSKDWNSEDDEDWDIILSKMSAI